ncbi:MAG: ribosome biogenesis GTPase Der [Verrucomicrobiae bacterium]|nr:ribosome biogenesis GTPase Der [Verrucomicrobiae bacterium]
MPLAIVCAMPGLIAIVGRPNVGKSALFNRIVGRRIAIVHDQPGVTRDRVSAEAEWRGRAFTLVDTGGIGLLRGEKAHDVIVRAAMEQVELAIASAEVIVLVVDAREGLMPLDREVAERLRRSGKPVLVAANKADTPQTQSLAVEFSELGFERVFPVSAIHGLGVEALMNAAVALLPTTPPPPADTARDTTDSEQGVAEPLKLAIVGRPNVGKSSIINALVGSPRVIVSPVPGTTRDAVDVPFEVETDGVRQRYVLIDTAGIRKKRRIADSIEFFSVQRAEHSIERCDIAVLVLDAEAGVLEQDKKIGGKILDAQKACVIAVNKWDLYEEAVRRMRSSRDAKKLPPDMPITLAEFAEWVQRQLFFLDFAPVIFTSATTGFHLDRLLEAVRYVAAQLQQKIPTALLNRALHDAVERRQPASRTGHRLKFFYATQLRTAPPTFLLFVNREDLLTEPYKKYLADSIRRAFGYEGCPIVLRARARPRDGERARSPERPRAAKR